MKPVRNISKIGVLGGILLSLAGCAGDPRAVALPLTYPDGSPVTTAKGEAVLAGYQTHGSATHSNATAIYERARPPTCATCAKVGAVVSEPSTLRQATGVLGSATMGTGAILSGIGAMEYGFAAEEGKLGTNVYNYNEENGEKNVDNYNQRYRQNYYHDNPVYVGRSGVSRTKGSWDDSRLGVNDSGSARQAIRRADGSYYSQANYRGPYGGYPSGYGGQYGNNYPNAYGGGYYPGTYGNTRNAYGGYYPGTYGNTRNAYGGYYPGTYGNTQYGGGTYAPSQYGNFGGTSSGLPGYVEQGSPQYWANLRRGYPADTPGWAPLWFGTNQTTWPNTVETGSPQYWANIRRGNPANTPGWGGDWFGTNRITDPTYGTQY